MADKNFLRKLLEKAAEKPQSQKNAPLVIITPPRLLATGLIVLCAVAWAFFMGFMVGRGQSPAQEIHAMTGMLEPVQDKATQQQAETASPDVSTSVIEDNSSVGPSRPAETSASPTVTPSAIASTPQTAPPKLAQTRPTSQKPVIQKQTAQKQKELQFDYVFQVSAVKNQKDAAKLVKQLSIKGIKASITKSGKVYLVIVSLRGGATEVDKLNSTFAAMKLGKPLRLSKKPVALTVPRQKRGNK